MCKYILYNYNYKIYDISNNCILLYIVFKMSLSFKYVILIPVESIDLVHNQQQN